LIVQILYLGVVWALRNLLNIQDRSDEHGFETRKSMLRLSRSLSQSLLQRQVWIAGISPEVI
jgi:hypothetical protein